MCVCVSECEKAGRTTFSKKLQKMGFVFNERKYKTTTQLLLVEAGLFVYVPSV